ncbi:MAG: PTS sugar transporter subunit IIA [Polyangiaceae bacterium]
MRLTELLTKDRVAIRPQGGAGGSGTSGPFAKTDVLELVARLLATGAHAPESTVFQVLSEREALQSTGIGDGVAIPHGALGELGEQCVALVVVRGGVDFDSIDGNKVNLVFGVIGPKRATGEHLKTLARISRLLRNRSFREKLVLAQTSEEAFALIDNEEGGNS